MDTRRFDVAAANLRQAFTRMGAALHPVKPTVTKLVDLSPVIGALQERLAAKPHPTIHAPLLDGIVERVRGTE